VKSKDKVKSGGIVIIPKDTLKCAKYKQLPPSSKLVFIALMTEWWRSKEENPNNEVRISQQTIKDLTGLSVTTIWRGMNSLKSSGFVEVKPEHQGGLERNMNTYTLKGRYLF
jgi:hypothetical protein